MSKIYWSRFGSVLFILLLLEGVKLQMIALHVKRRLCGTHCHTPPVIHGWVHIQALKALEGKRYFKDLFVPFRPIENPTMNKRVTDFTRPAVQISIR